MGDRATRAGRDDRSVPRRGGARHDSAGWRSTLPTPAAAPTASPRSTPPGLIAAAFTHRDSRAGDPDLHTHVAVIEQGLHRRWAMAVAGRSGAVPEQGRRIRALQHPAGSAAHRAGRGAVRRPRRRRRRQAGGPRDRRSRPRRCCASWSSRRGDIEAELAVLARRFQDEHSRPPTVIERQELASKRRCPPGRRSTNRARRPSNAAAGSPTPARSSAEQSRVDELVRRVIGHAPVHRTPTVDVDVLAEQVIATVQASRATWQEHHVRAEAERACRRLAAVPDFLVDAVTDRALSPANSVLLTVAADDRRARR